MSRPSMRTAPYEWIWEHWRELTPAQKNVVRRRIHREMHATLRAFGRAIKSANRSMTKFAAAASEAIAESSPGAS